MDVKQKGQIGALRIMREIKREAQRSGRGTRWWTGGDSDPRPQELIQQKLTGTPDGERGGGGDFFVCHPHVFSELFFLNFIYLFIYYYYYFGCVGSSFLCEGFL